MELKELKYLQDLLHEAKGFIKLGCRSEHHMEQEIFKTVNDQMNNIYNYVSDRISEMEKR